MKRHDGRRKCNRQSVAPFAGAWIETHPSTDDGSYTWSLPSRERGLKQLTIPGQLNPVWSLPSRERGLKHTDLQNLSFLQVVAPFAGAWIETEEQSSVLRKIQSLPSRERGLKPCIIRHRISVCVRRSLRGSVD